MRRCRLGVATLLAAAATASVLSLPAAASADADITIAGVGSAAGNAGLLTVTAASLTPLTSLTVHLTGPAGVATVTDFGLTGSGSGEQTYVVQTPLTAADQGSPDYLAAGNYTATVDASDAGDSVSDVPAGRFAFLIQPTLTATASTTTIRYGQQSVTFSGQLTGILPGGSTPQDLGGVPIFLVDQDTSVSQQVATTAADGSYAATERVTTDSYLLQASGSATAAGAGSAPIKIGAATDPVQLTARLAKSAVSYGQKDSVSGAVTYQPGSPGPFQPLPGTTVTLTDSATPRAHPVTALTGSRGTFTIGLPKQTAAGDWTVSAGGTALLGAARKTLPLKVALPTAFRQVQISLSAFRVLTLRACLNVTSPGGASDSVTASVTLQYARAAKGPWKKLRTIRAAHGAGYCRHGTSSWQSMGSAPLASGYYRLSFGGNKSLQRAVSPAARRRRDPTRITSFSVTPRQVTAKDAITISGRLWRHGGSWRPDGGAKVAILFRYRGTWFIFQDEPRTNSRGYFSGRFTVYVTASWIAQFDGDKTHFATATSRIKVTVVRGSALPVSRPGPALRGARAARGGDPLHAGQTAQLGGRLARNAAIPSAASAEANRRAD